MTLIPTAEDSTAGGATIKASRVRAAKWFASGARRGYDLVAKRMTDAAEAPPSARVASVLERVVGDPSVSAEARWLTMLPGFPDGSYGFAQVDRLLTPQATPRLHVEYGGQGDSDKPDGYRYGTRERADLVQAQSREHRIRRTLVVTFDYSSLVLLELLRRQQAHTAGATSHETTSDARPRPPRVLGRSAGRYSTRTPAMPPCSRAAERSAT